MVYLPIVVRQRKAGGIVKWSRRGSLRCNIFLKGYAARAYETKARFVFKPNSHNKHWLRSRPRGSVAKNFPRHLIIKTPSVRPTTTVHARALIKGGGADERAEIDFRRIFRASPPTRGTPPAAARNKSISSFKTTDDFFFFFLLSLLFRFIRPHGWTLTAKLD